MMQLHGDCVGLLLICSGPLSAEMQRAERSKLALWSMKAERSHLVKPKLALSISAVRCVGSLPQPRASRLLRLAVRLAKT
jgi:hypothetical protein